ncbi:hypothetical protein EN925_32480 [Mesorhizobium sp. M7A.F.Ca.US.006.04.2.1]|nr:hypothetical protein A9K65_033340 [Mesorhizobium sp. WSM1497]RUU15718.1 hypothetical protein EOC84_31485 [Mesorhizobium sp. Primo-B]RUU34890.1 hypothetical protein EOC83_27780 [Mesorhizobium sp. Primo-A]RUX71056.1 hypothetical protein EN990_29800 [Mesorhizobium sp. M7A.F.Ca.US.005.03.1.1]RUY10382.1 hypothetical protein EN991_27495 [Mesorhizobium sp. M7A.F.Ca.US.005.03.2.1]RUY22051.1 hypothetical protein EN979_32985 [Mesorhizobium sp. M7A.F.Ca.US.001.04.2.1]RUY35684.1 hypothetical protein E
MPLSQKLSSVEMTLKCPGCGNEFTKPGRWFIVAAHYRCEGCQRLHRLPYPEKVELFERYAQGCEDGLGSIDSGPAPLG